MAVSWQVGFYRNGFLHFRGRPDVLVGGTGPPTRGFGIAPFGLAPFGA
jgi:hypothetical protein